jgi:hypothetical protein
MPSGSNVICSRAKRPRTLKVGLRVQSQDLMALLESPSRGGGFSKKLTG